MKSLCDEIRLRRDADGFNFICKADFIRASRGFHREQCERFHLRINHADFGTDDIQCFALILMQFCSIITAKEVNLWIGKLLIVNLTIF